MQTNFLAIDSFLLSYQEFWRQDPFFLCQEESVSWQNTSPPLMQWLDELSHQDITDLKAQSDRLVTCLSRFFPELNEMTTMITLPRENLSGLTLSRNTSVGVPGRKLEQILAMGESALSDHYGNEWLEWCSGKGFLGRILAQQSEQKVTSFEWQQSLCESGQEVADAQRLNMQFVQGDAFSPSSELVFNSNQHAVALHACGDLHVKLLQNSVAHQLPAVTISPCCYHLIQDESYQALSLLAQQSQLVLSKADLRVPLQETVTGGERVKRHRQLEMTFRLGFSALLKAELGFEEYMPVPSIKKSLLDDGFQAFCEWAAAQKSLELPKVEFEQYQQLGEVMFWKMEKFSLIQQVFRRPLEIWLALDKAMYLQEQGYQVSISEFCEKRVTPRNILIHAHK
ncbi:methyltransferase [Vibrio sp. T187]|uniref:methyltransferase n=1 Tax=Vibrio TaxID=662 RepID=UPI0010C9E0E5|nr:MULTISPECIES: methyltransferase [Vibrio]MBW3694625.1 methyltransferase [Vibrio sp. T187]